MIARLLHVQYLTQITRLPDDKIGLAVFVNE